MFNYGKLVLERSRAAFESRGMSTVWLVRDKHNKRFVVKRIPRNLSIEVDVLQRLDHPNICRLIEVVRTGEDAFSPDDGFLYLVLEYCEGGDLFDRIIAQEALSLIACKSIIRQLASALAYCHERGVLHGDVKPEQVVCLSKDAWDVKLLDFGLSVLKPTATKRNFGTQVYAAPEIVAGTSEYSEACDMFSLGVTLYVMVFGEFPDRENFRFPFEIPGDLQSLIISLLSEDPAKRPTAKEAFDHSWVTSETHENDERLRASTVEGLRGFARQTNFRKACVSVAAKAVDFQDLKSLHATFLGMDKDGNGVVTWAEFLDALRGEIGDEEEVRTLFESIDTDKSGGIDYSEFLAAALTKKRGIQREVAREAFRFIDKDDSGFIEKIELEEFVRTFELKEYFEDEAIEAVINRMTNDRKISLDQFEGWLVERLSSEISDVVRRRSSVKIEDAGRGSQLGLPIRSRH
jgi:calcium-dependent protein kinase